MNDREILKNLNGINYKEEEINEYINFEKINDMKVSKITTDVRTKISKEKVKDAGIYVERNVLEKGEVIEKVVKGTDIDMLRTVTAVNVVMTVPFMTWDGYSFNRLIFCTNRRIIILGVNYYNNKKAIKIYDREDIEGIDMGRKIKEKYRFGVTLDLKRNKSKKFKVILKFLFQVFAAYLLSNVFSIFAYKISDGSNIIRIIALIIFMIGFSYFFTTRRNLDTEVLMEFNDGEFYDLLIRNIDYEEIHEYFSKINYFTM